MLVHTQGIVIGRDVKIGEHCRLYSGVVLGVAGKEKDQPILGKEVTVYSGAKVVGGIRLGDGCVVGANAVVTRDVKAHTTVIGIPAKPMVFNEE